MQIHLVLTKVFLNSLLIEIQVKRIYADVCIVFTLKIYKKKNSIITQMCVCACFGGKEDRRRKTGKESYSQRHII